MKIKRTPLILALALVTVLTLSSIAFATPAHTSAQKQTAAAAVFTAQELAQYNGQGGNKAYIAVSGKIYDVTALFVNGQHHGVRAGQDLTAVFADEHGDSRLSSFPVVGTLEAAPASAADTQTGSQAGAQTGAQTSESQKQLQALEQQEDELDRQEDELDVSYRGGKLSAADYLKQKAALKQQESQLELQMDALEAAGGHDSAYDDDRDDHDDDHDDHNDDHDNDRDDHDDDNDRDDD
ncbi:MAG: hypothetical protein LKJ80_07615 [Oscillibacter sp.]|jgi:predicted heme/steroid binding protein|nr:hypothetical protein [Oscillibacter sp.]